jgi:hypothetical protein
LKKEEDYDDNSNPSESNFIVKSRLLMTLTNDIISELELASQHIKKQVEAI